MRYIILLLSFVFFIFFKTQAQLVNVCVDIHKQNIEEITKNSFTPDGKFTVLTLEPGQKKEILRTFFATKEYLIIIEAQDANVGLLVEIKDISNKTIFSNKEPRNRLEISYTPQRSQNLTISITAQKIKDNTNCCVSLAIGYR